MSYTIWLLKHGWEPIYTLAKMYVRNRKLFTEPLYTQLYTYYKQSQIRNLQSSIYLYCVEDNSDVGAKIIFWMVCKIIYAVGLIKIVITWMFFNCVICLWVNNKYTLEPKRKCYNYDSVISVRLCSLKLVMTAIRKWLTILI